MCVYMYIYLVRLKCMEKLYRVLEGASDLGGVTN